MREDGRAVGWNKQVCVESCWMTRGRAHFKHWLGERVGHSIICNNRDWRYLLSLDCPCPSAISRPALPTHQGLLVINSSSSASPLSLFLLPRGSQCLFHIQPYFRHLLLFGVLLPPLHGDPAALCPDLPRAKTKTKEANPHPAGQPQRQHQTVLCTRSKIPMDAVGAVRKNRACIISSPQRVKVWSGRDMTSFHHSLTHTP